MRFALLPMKPLALAKSRLAPHLADADRQAVSLAMFQDVLECLCRATSIDSVAVVTSDRRLLDLAMRMRALAIDETAPRGLNGAVGLGTATCIDRGATSVLIVLSDLPLITAEEVDALSANFPEAPHVRLVRSHEGLGTNAILRSPPTVIGTRFGGRSFQSHVEAASAAGVPYSTAELPGLGFDVDTIEDLQRLTSAARPSRAFFAAQRIGLSPARHSERRGF
jgi:2-phospho-L-lactate/phosphoenolpyruvate guanylyltransferase